MSVQPGWYLDPAAPETRRYWDGEGWVGAPIPADATPPEGPPPPAPPEPVTASQSPPDQSVPGFAAHPPGYHPGPPSGHPQGPPPGWPHPGYPVRPPEPRPHGLALAGFGSRLVARLIDFGIVFLLNAVVNGWFVWHFIEETTPMWREIGRRWMSRDPSTDPLPQPGEQVGGLQVAILLIATTLWFAYEVPTMASTGQTFGKRVMGIKVMPLAGDRPLGFGHSLRRWNTLGLPTLLWYCCGFGLLLQFIDAVSPLFDHPLRQALHDKRAQTVVVQLPRTADSPARPTPNDRAEPPGDTP